MNELATAHDPLGRFLAMAPRIVSILVSLLALVWWAAGIERRVALLEQSTLSVKASDQALAARLDLAMSRHVDQIQRIEDRINRHIDDDRERFDRLTKPCKAGK